MLIICFNPNFYLLSTNNLINKKIDNKTEIKNWYIITFIIPPSLTDEGICYLMGNNDIKPKYHWEEYCKKAY